MPVNEVVVGELGVIGHVGEVGVNLLARAIDERADDDRLHGAASYPRPAREESDVGRSGGRALIGDPHRVTELGAMNDVRTLGCRPLSPATQLTGDRARRVLVDPLTDQRGAMAVRALLRHPRQTLVEAAPQKRQLKLQHVLRGGRHGGVFVTGGRAPARPRIRRMALDLRPGRRSL
jgi:hypothetical protein